MQGSHCTKLIKQYMVKSMKDPESLWLMRKQFAIQSAANMFLTYMCCLHGRAPSRFQFSRKTGGMYMSEILPGAQIVSTFDHAPNANRTATAAGTPIITSSEAVPFRLTPNMQHFITKTGVEGTVTAVLTALSKSLTGPEFDLSGILTIFLRDEVSLLQHNRSSAHISGRLLAQRLQTREQARYGKRYTCIHKCGQVYQACRDNRFPRREQG
jgi:transformation/transcription domain-associated protein